MKKDIEKFEKYVIDFANTKVEAVRETIKQVGVAGTEIAKQAGECARLKEKNNRESEKEIIETIEKLRKDNENGRNDEGIKFYEKLLLEKQKEKAKQKEMYMKYGFGAIAITGVVTGVVWVTREAIRSNI